ncbi:hypothetical protein NEUTE2DRAFT_52625, partial [Neurospora tetrasperma FGSC 2509]
IPNHWILRVDDLRGSKQDYPYIPSRRGSSLPNNLGIRTKPKRLHPQLIILQQLQVTFCHRVISLAWSKKLLPIA